LKCLGMIKAIRKSTIPYTNVMEIECEDGKKIEMLVHDELLNFIEKEKVEVEISEKLPEYKDGRDLCGRAMMYKDEGERKFFSIGGFIVVVWGDKEENYKPGEKYFMCVKHVQG